MRRKLAIALVPALALLALAARPALHAGKSAAVKPRRQSAQPGMNMKVFHPSAMFPAVPQTIQGGLWRTDGGFQSVLMLRNALDDTSITVTPVVYMADGTELDLTPVSLGPAGVAMVDINTALADAPAALGGHISSYGSAAVKSTWSWQPVLAAVRSTDDVRGLIYQMHMEADANRIASPKSAITQQVEEGAWWKEEARVGGFLGLTNTTPETITASVAVGDNGGTNVVRRQYSLGPHATSWIDFASFWSQLPASDAGSVEISYRGPMYAVVANGGMEDASNGYSHMLHFYVPESLILRERLAAMAPHLHFPASVVQPTTHWSASTTLDAAGIMVGSQDADMQFPSGTRFTPYLVLRNTTASAMPVRLGANAMSGASPQDVPLGALQLAAFETRRIQVAPLLAASALAGMNGYINLQATYSGTPTDLQEVSGSVDQSFNYVFEVPTRPEVASTPSLINYWNANGETETMITVYNYGGAAQDVVLKLAHRAGTYEMPIHLEPHASRSFTLGRLIRRGVPDRNGAIIPANIVQGSAKIGGATGRHEERTTVEIQVAVFNPRTATCGYSCITCNSSVNACFDPDSVTMTVGGGSSPDLYVYYEDDSREYADTNTYTSGSTSIATVDDSGDIAGVGAGHTIVEAVVTAESGGDFCCTGGYCDSYTTYYPDADVYVTPQILVGLDGNTPSTDITGGTQNVVAGEMVEIQVNAGNTDASGASWTLGGTTNGGWSPSTGATGAPSAASTSGSTTTVYWVSAGSDSVQVSVAGQSAGATVSVNAPTNISVNVTTGSWQKLTPSDDYEVFGGASSDIGIFWTASGSMPAGDAGTLKWGQILTDYEVDIATPSGTQRCESASYPLLDNVYPYGVFKSAGVPEDNPSIDLSEISQQFSGSTAATLTVGATMYLLWNSGLSNAIDVPLGSGTWAASGTAQYHLGWSDESTQDSGGASTFSVSAPSYPTWAGTFYNGLLGGCEAYAAGHVLFGAGARLRRRLNAESNQSKLERRMGLDGGPLARRPVNEQ